MTVHRKKLKRYDIPGHARALNFSCFRNQPFLRSERACGWFVDSALESLPAHAMALWAWCIMPTHVHLLVDPGSDTPRVSAFLKALKLRVNKIAIAWVRENMPGTLHVFEDESPSGEVSLRFWQRGGGYDRNLFRPAAIWKEIDYVHMNPVVAGLVDRPEDWKWSSAGYYFDRRPSLLPLDLSRLPPMH